MNQEEKTKYDIEYIKMNCKRIAFNLNKEHDKDIILYLENKPNVQGYLKALIREDMKR